MTGVQTCALPIWARRCVLPFVLGSLLSGGCNLPSPGDSIRRDAGEVVVPPSADAICGVTSNCRNGSTVCVRSPGASMGTCEPPPSQGECQPDGASEGEAVGCYPSARCSPAPRALSARGGLCTFGGAPLTVFPVSQSAKIALVGPTQFDVLRADEAVALRWTPPSRQSPDTVAVALVMRRPPQRVEGANRIRNPEDLVWIWSTTAPRGAATGEVSLRAGFDGLNPDGSLRAAYGRDTLPAGRYWWLTFTIANGLLQAASDAVSFRVGEDFSARPCEAVADCLALVPGETADRVLCLRGQCRRRCASALDCPGAGRRCD